VFEGLTNRPQPFTIKEIEQFRDSSVPELIKLLRIPKWKVPILLFRGRRMLREHLYGIPVHKGMAEALHTLHEHGVPLFILSSNSTENVRKYLQRHKLLDCFDGVYGGASLLGKAPLILKLLGKEKLRPDHTWYVGDEMRDVSAARAVGMKSISVTWGYNTHAALITKEPDHLVDTAQELLKALEPAWKK
jgi:phosphoglycolate phosphatase